MKFGEAARDKFGPCTGKIQRRYISVERERFCARLIFRRRLSIEELLIAGQILLLLHNDRQMYTRLMHVQIITDVDST